MMARSTNAPFKGRIQKRKTNHLQIITFGLQRNKRAISGIDPHQLQGQVSSENYYERHICLAAASGNRDVRSLE